MPSPPPEPDDGDPILDARVAHAVAPYIDLLPTEELEALRSMTRRFLATHPVTAPLVERLRPRADPYASGEVDPATPALVTEAAKWTAMLAELDGSRAKSGAPREATPRRRGAR